MLFLRTFFGLAIAIILYSFTVGSAKSFHVQLELTPEASTFISNLEEQEKSNWFDLIPDSIPLNATFVLKGINFPSTKVYFKIGSIDGIEDVYYGAYDFSNPQGGIEYSTNNNVHYFKLGNITNYKSFTAYAWINDSTGNTVELLRYSK